MDGWLKADDELVVSRVSLGMGLVEDDAAVSAASVRGMAAATDATKTVLNEEFMIDTD